ncbi:peptide ABC transporter permease [Methylobacterium sp. E-041]|uniref:peptide ABC transporter permease n=1 Tax=unclassified Methylobacterium TaxID=2615210 RepID=UPI0011C96A22|nr:MULTISPECIES: peptide ABC transporter permease [unclassified Methylobacterium]MCJ2039896.1 peptide ABC transporter permease [Methylobacterium sp. J-059]MCJ2076731.1 peptide ABC transporter permease [Methylobacterium sp. E-016]MCJ2107421.1 peptide ABC transporter permease [Methylobacterium sp. E-041]TXN42042.1 peptide ABC transporter permease [Methylobacterium sp. WL93]TXN52700.1 peptide ABC transporter permease [Methylobacterium sp. WL119]
MARPSTQTIDPALDAAALLRRVGFFGLFVIVPVVAQVARRATVILAPIAVALLIIASAIDGRQRPLLSGSARLLRAPAFLAGLLVLVWMALSLVWTPFPGAASERFANLVATILLTLAGYMALPDRMRSANLYLLPLGVTAAAIVAIVLGLFGDTLMRGVPDDDNALDRGLTLLALLLWPSVAWLRSRRRDREALGLAVVVAVALAVSPNVGQIAALAIGALAFAVTSFRPRLGVGLTAGLAAGLLAVAPLLPFLARPIGAALFGPLSPGVLTLKSWQRIVTTEPVRLITGHGFETALRGRVFGLIPVNAPSTALFAMWYELGVVGALAAAFALYASIRRAGRDVPLLVPGAMAGFAAAFTIACIGVGLTVVWWLTTLAITILVFVAIERGQFRTRRPKVSRLKLPTPGEPPRA